MDPLTILLILGGGALIGSLASGGNGKKKEAGEYPKGEVLGEYPGGLFTFESLTPAQKQILQTIMQYAMPKLGLPGQAFGQAPAGTTAGVGLGAGARGGGNVLSGLLGAGSQPPGGGGM